MAQAERRALPLWGFSHLGRQTECERIPRPRNKSLQAKLTSDLAVYRFWNYATPALKVPFDAFNATVTALDDCTGSAVARNPREFVLSVGTRTLCLVLFSTRQSAFVSYTRVENVLIRASFRGTT